MSIALYQVAFPPRHHEFSHCVEQMMAATGVLEPGCYNLTSIWRVQPKFFMVYSSISTKKKQPCWIHQRLLRWSHSITIISCHLPWWNLIKSESSSLVKKFCDAAITRHAAHSKHRDMAEGCGSYGRTLQSDTNWMVGKTLGFGIRWFMAWKPTTKRPLSQMRSLNVYKSKGLKMLAESLESPMSGLSFAHSWAAAQPLWIRIDDAFHVSVILSCWSFTRSQPQTKKHVTLLAG